MAGGKEVRLKILNPPNFKATNFQINMIESFTLIQINEAAKKFFEKTANRTIIAIHGSMGAGKTTFISALCKSLGVEETTGSPTYSIINQYKTAGGKTIFHMDWYRLKDEEEAIAAGVEEALYSGNLCLIEWPEKASSILPDDTLHVTIEAIDANTRKIVI